MEKKENVLQFIMRELSTRRDYGLNECSKLMWSKSTEISAFYIKEGYRNQGDIRAFARFLATDVLSEAVLQVSKENLENSKHSFPIEFASFLSEGVDHINKLFVDGKIKTNDKKHQEIVQRYRETIYNILKPRIDEFNNTVTQSPIAATELLSVVPVPQIVYDKRVLGPFVGKVIHKLILLSTNYVRLDGGMKPLYEPYDKATVQDIFEFLFGSDKLHDTARAVLMSYDNGVILDENGKCKIIGFAASIFESMDSKQLKKELKQVVDFKMKDTRKIDLRVDKIDLSEYPRIAKRLQKIMEKKQGK